MEEEQQNIENEATKNKGAIWTTKELTAQFHAKRKAKGLKTNQYLEFLLGADN